MKKLVVLLAQLVLPILGRRRRGCAALMIVFFPLICVDIARAANYEFERENRYFDKNRIDAATLLKKSYSESKGLFLGAANHRNKLHHEHLIDLLKEVGRDPRLKYLVLEQFHDNDGFYRQLSLNPISEVLKNHSFPSQHGRLITLCWSREWSWVYTHVFPVIQQINAERPANNPLIVRGVDGFLSREPFGLISMADVTAENCKFIAPELLNTRANLQNREVATAQNFYSEVWSKLRDDEKIIVLYHQNHLYRHFDSCRITRTSEGAVSAIAPRNWFGVFLKAHPEAELSTRLVIFDEADENHHPNGVLQFTKRQTERYPGEQWAIDVRDMKGIDLERGQNGWIFSAVSYDNGGQNHSDRYFYEIFDSVIYSPRAEVEHKIPDVTENLPEVCTGNYNGNSLLPANERKP
jgi:hypothetical protein